MAGRILNELVENGNHSGPSVDAIADMFIFDPLGILLFQSERVSRFFSHRLNLANWSYQPMFGVLDQTIENVGDHYSIKWFPTEKVPLGLILCAGIHSSAGLSYRKDNEYCVSLSGGISINKVIDVETESDTRVQTVTTTWNTSLFIDRNNSLLASLILSGDRRYRCQANVYPGLIPSKRIKLGAFFAIKESWEPTLGVTCTYTPIGIAL